MATLFVYVYILETLLKQAVAPEQVRILTGHEKDSSAQRDDMFGRFKDTPGAVLITPLVKEGVPSLRWSRCMVIPSRLAR